MKKFFKEFREFISKGNVLDLAVGVIIGGAFNSVVKGLTDNIIQPLLNCLGGAEVQGRIRLFGTDNYIDYGAFISAVINFLIMALVIFLIIKFVNKAEEAALRLSNKNREQEIPAPTTKICPFCKSEIAIDATRCPHCTSMLDEKNKICEDKNV
ncbi:large conductance mechanosensitive channel protein MscL [uncultured Eubacterium sp.]|uniref:large conductance mechanosensitive channel protein MscL n=1 Tax=uncultured Eubacterium sp. TaxID=165185 RepID=UPI0015A90404|nr:large conductance mechanosensitive channel protein MscL [uncultured Eubacterium sp.]